MRYLAILAFVVTLAFFGAIVMRLASDAKWDAYKQKHHCRPAPHIPGTTDLASKFDLRGRYVPPTYQGPQQERWLCDNGMVFTR